MYLIRLVYLGLWLLASFSVGLGEAEVGVVYSVTISHITYELYQTNSISIIPTLQRGIAVEGTILNISTIAWACKRIKLGPRKGRIEDAG